MVATGRKCCTARPDQLHPCGLKHDELAPAGYFVPGEAGGGDHKRLGGQVSELKKKGGKHLVSNAPPGGGSLGCKDSFWGRPSTLTSCGVAYRSRPPSFTRSPRQAEPEFLDSLIQLVDLLIPCRCIGSVPITTGSHQPVVALAVCPTNPTSIPWPDNACGRDHGAVISYWTRAQSALRELRLQGGGLHPVLGVDGLQIIRPVIRHWVRA
jgi:hypothetical protein